MLRATIHFSPLPCSDLQEHDEQGEQTTCLTSCLIGKLKTEPQITTHSHTYAEINTENGE